MFAVGDKVFYRGNGMLPGHKELVVERVVGNKYLLFKPDNVKRKTRYLASSFVSAAANAIPDLMTELHRKARHAAGTCSYALEFTNGKQRYHVQDVCHARMSFGWYNDNNNKNLVLSKCALHIHNHYNRIRDNERNHYALGVDYIINSSPWKNAFIPTPTEEVLERGIEIDVTQPYSYCVSAAIALRTFSEFESQRKYFAKMVKLGVNEDIAFIASAFCNQKFHIDDKWVDMFRQFDGGHHVISGVVHTPANLRAFFVDKKITNDDGPYFKAVGKSYRIFPVLGGGEYARDGKGIFTQVMNHIPKDMKKRVKMVWGDGVEYVDLGEDENLLAIAKAFEMVLK